MKDISESAVRRLSLYVRYLQEFEGKGFQTTSSEELATKGGITSAQVRKDLSLFGCFGKRGLGYDVKELKKEIVKLLGLNKSWNVALIGAGNIGSALFSYKQFRRQGFNIAAVFDNDPRKIGWRWDNITVEHIDRLKERIVEMDIKIGIVVTSAEGAQSVVDLLVEAGVKAILNFAPKKLMVPPDITLRNVDMAIELEGLSFILTNGNKASR